MITLNRPNAQVLLVPNVWEKLRILPSELRTLLCGEVTSVPATPGRDVQILPIRELPAKRGLSTREGQARLLHDLASIELQAMELGLRTLHEFPEAPPRMREELTDVTFEEGTHLRLCLEALQELGFPWGSFPTHLGLWQCVSAADSLLDRLLIVHRYLEGSGLDASVTLQRRLAGVPAPEARRAVDVIARDEIGHVSFGSRWYHELAPSDDFAQRLARLSERVPRRLEPIQPELRRRAGFTDGEIAALEALRDRFQGL